ncbi:endolysin [Microbacterium phage OscarSo]|uniref:Endolysin n=1 Tax=Microbacterium phage OscarSo TaxID=2985324 RepID=A0A9X9K2T0_9CAUD|nr:endolysin [Microbacterium phage OscarSo]UYL87135.1 endolysin [Microbacterium phage OscarSo]
MTVYWPNGSLTRPRVSSDFDAARKNPVTGIVQPHNGIDLVGWADNCSPVDGTVVFAGYNGGAGNEVRIRADGPTAFHVGDHYRILHHASLYVRTGDRVKARQPVGRMGTTGQSTGVHCHFETHEYRLWNPVNPSDYMRRANAGASPAGGEEDDMFTDADRALLTEVRLRLRGDLPDVDILQDIQRRIRGPKSENFDMIQRIRSLVEEIYIRIRGPKPNIDMIQDILKNVSGETVEVDEEALGKAIGESLAVSLADSLGTLSDSTIDALAKRILDEQSKRLAE